MRSARPATAFQDAQGSNRSAFADRSTADRRPQRAVRRLDHFPPLDGGVRRTRADIPDKRYPFGFDTTARNRTVPVFESASGPIRSSFAGRGYPSSRANPTATPSFPG